MRARNDRAWGRMFPSAGTASAEALMWEGAWCVQERGRLENGGPRWWGGPHRALWATQLFHRLPQRQDRYSGIRETGWERGERERPGLEVSREETRGKEA